VAKQTLDGEDRSEIIEKEGKPVRDSRRFLKREASQTGCAERVSTMVLFEARGLWLFSVIRGGIELTQRLSAGALVRPTTGLDTLPRTERFENRLGQRQDNPEVGIGSHHTLKLLAVSILLDRSVLLSSKWIKRSPPFYGPRLDAPSSASSL
jgi:hypothetical protein